MREQDIRHLEEWFDHYTESFFSSNREDQKNISLKIDHSRCVRKNIVDIAKGEGLDENAVRVAGVIGLFHDIGRFPQYATYRTFRDADSKSHGLLGYKALVEQGVLSGLPPDEQQLILTAVRFHGAFAIPSLLNGDSVLYLKLIRDADKIDIYRVFIEYYESPPGERASATAFGVPETPEYSQKMLSNIMQGKIASYSDIRTENDFRLMKLSWVYDMNFDASIRLLVQKGYVDRLMGMMPDTREISMAMDRIKRYIEERVKRGQ